MSQNETKSRDSHPVDEQDRSGRPPAPGGDSSPGESPDLTDRQIRALPYLVSSATVTEGVKLAGISRATFYRWMDDVAFRSQFETLRADVQRYAYAELRGLTLKGVLVLAQMLEDPSPAIKLKAVQTALSAGIKISEMTDIEEKIDRIEDAFLVQRSRKAIL